MTYESENGKSKEIFSVSACSNASRICDAIVKEPVIFRELIMKQIEEIIQRIYCEGERSLKLKNIGKVSEEWLKEIGVYNYEDLNEIGAVEAFKRIKQKHPFR